LISTLRETNEVLATVRDKATADAARPRLVQLHERVQALKKKAEALPEPARERATDLEAKYKKELQEVVQKAMEEAARVEKIPGGETLLREWGGARWRRVPRGGNARPAAPGAVSGSRADWRGYSRRGRPLGSWPAVLHSRSKGGGMNRAIVVA